MKTTIALLAATLLCTEARRGGRNSYGGSGMSRFQGQQGGQAGGRFSGGKQGGGGRGNKGGKVLSVLEHCQEEIDFSCVLDDYSAAELLEVMTAHKQEVEAWKESGREGEKPERPGDDVKSALEFVRQCIGTIKENLPEDSACLEAISSGGKGKGGKGKGAKMIDEAIASCGAEIEISCALNFDIYALADTMAAYKAAAEEAKANGERPERLPEEVKEQAKAVGSCIKELKDDSACLAGLGEEAMEAAVPEK
jgi:hypothetical protein